MFAAYVPTNSCPNCGTMPAWEQAILSVVGVVIAFAILYGLYRLAMFVLPKAPKASDDGQLDLTTPVNWERTTDGEFPFRARVDGQEWQLSANSHGGPPYRLLIDTQQRAVLHAWPEHWYMPPRSAS
jgi:hypothetical protein